MDLSADNIFREVQQAAEAVDDQDLSSGGTSSLLYQTVPPLYQSAVPLMYQGPAWDRGVGTRI